MERVPVNSSNLAAIGYDEASETLEVEFRNTGLYAYYNVPPFMHERLMAAPSVGAFFNTEIKHAYPCSKL